MAGVNPQKRLATSVRWTPTIYLRPGMGSVGKVHNTFLKIVMFLPLNSIDKKENPETIFQFLRQMVGVFIRESSISQFYNGIIDQDSLLDNNDKISP